MEYVFTGFRIFARREDDREVFAFGSSDCDVARFAVVMAGILFNDHIAAEDARGANQIKSTLCKNLLTFRLIPADPPADVHLCVHKFKPRPPV
jgi:hypothetical protein